MAQTDFERTSWRGIVVDHPAGWELSIASGADEPGRVSFADRRFTRLDVTWRPLTYVPNLDLMIEKYRQRKTSRKDEVTFKPLQGLGAQWRGVIRQAGGGTFVHAGRFFAPRRWLVEATLVWLERRNQALEREIFASIQAEPPEEPLRHWRALGMDVRVGRDLDLLVSDPKVGRVTWTFGAPRKKRSPQLVVERLAMVEHWLAAEGGLEEWLAKSLPEKSHVAEKSSITFNAHPAQRLLSEKKIGTLPTLRGLRQRRLDVAWVCPVDGRLYHLAVTQARRDRDVRLPEGFEMKCCVPSPVLPAGDEL
jgi:hypothetical protein